MSCLGAETSERDSRMVKVASTSMRWSALGYVCGFVLALKYQPCVVATSDVEGGGQRESLTDGTGLTVGRKKGPGTINKVVVWGDLRQGLGSFQPSGACLLLAHGCFASRLRREVAGRAFFY